MLGEKMRINRLFSILLNLQLHEQLTTKELAQKLEVSERTIHRDMDVLSAEGFPVYAEKGKYGGWKLLQNYKPKIMQLNQEEMPVLFLPLSEKIQQDLGIKKEVELAQMKLLSILPQKTRKDAEYMLERIHLDSSHWHPTKKDQVFLASLQNALWRDQKVWIEYLRADQENRKRLVNPLGLVAKGSTWYLIASLDDQIRTYRVDRIKQVEVTEESFTRPHDFCLASYWKKSTEQFVERLPQYHVVAQVDAAILQNLSYAGRFPKIDVLEEQMQAGWSKVALQFQVEQEALAFIMGFGAKIRVIEPDVLRRKIQQKSEEIVALYKGKA
ncbi:WYL domain-containing protein [Shimazuella sp. KC615]|uniref:WYL domain-containing protein n=2 Tax=Shimazuella alba TaxID=2690964 RepID=A0A6I4VSV5_9BACL|nr:WYL domain-containing protein [Shimazuella alba]